MRSRKTVALLLTVGLVVLALGLCLTACSSSDATDEIHGTWYSPTPILYVTLDADGESIWRYGPPADEIHGTWYLADSYVYVTLDADGEWSAREGLEGPEFDWGTYTFEDGVLTQSNAEGSHCSGATIVSNVSFEENGDELHLDFISDTCTKSTGRAVDQVFIRYTP
jgi:hypothetical protein